MSGKVPEFDDLGKSIDDEFIDGKTTLGPWGIMTRISHSIYGIWRLGVGLGQMYKKQKDGQWLKVDG